MLTTHSQDVKCVQWHPDVEVGASCEALTFNVLLNYCLMQCSVACLQILASCSYDNSIKLYKEEADDWTCFATLSWFRARLSIWL